MNERSKRINEAIEKSGYSYPELSKITGISKSSLQRYATGETKKIPIDCIEKIAQATGSDSRYLMCWDDEEAEVQIVSTTQSTISDDDIKFALFDGAEGVTDAMYDEVKQFAAMVKMREDAKRKEGK